MIRLVALYLVLRILLARMMDVSFVIHILPVDFHNPAAHVPGLGVPGHVIAYFEFTRHDSPPRLHATRAEMSLSSRCTPKGRSVGSPPRSLGPVPPENHIRA